MFHNLGSVTCPDRQVKAAKVMNILRCISPSETAMFEQHELSSVHSDLEDPFSDDDDHITATIKKKVTYSFLYIVLIRILSLKNITQFTAFNPTRKSQIFDELLLGQS